MRISYFACVAITHRLICHCNSGVKNSRDSTKHQKKCQAELKSGSPKTHTHTYTFVYMNREIRGQKNQLNEFAKRKINAPNSIVYNEIETRQTTTNAIQKPTKLKIVCPYQLACICGKKFLFDFEHYDQQCTNRMHANTQHPINADGQISYIIKRNSAVAH